MRILFRRISSQTHGAHTKNDRRPSSIQRKRSLGDDLEQKLVHKQRKIDIGCISDSGFHREGRVQWRRNDFSQKEMNKRSWGQDDYIMDSHPFHGYELEQAQHRENMRVADKRPTGNSWSCAEFNPKELDLNWQEEHV